MRIHGLVWGGIGFIAGAVCTKVFFMSAQDKAGSLVENTHIAVAENREPKVSNPSTLSGGSAKTQLNESKTPQDALVDTVDVTTYSRDDSELSMDDLAQENQQLHREVERLNAQLMVKQQVPDMAETIAATLATEVRDPQFADEMELQVKDFVYQFGFDQEVELSTVNCKSTVCEISFTSKDISTFDERTWRKVSEKLTETSWWRAFKASTATSGNNQMTILATTTWSNDPKRVSQ